MSASVLSMSMSLDGYIAGPNDEVGNPGGDGFDRLHEWFAPGGGEFVRPAGAAGELFDEVLTANGASVVGRRTAEQVEHWGGDMNGIPIFVVSHRPPDPSVANLSAGDVRDRWDRERDGAGEGRRRGPQRVRARRVHGATGVRGRCAGRGADVRDPGAVRWWPSAVRRVAIARRAGDRSGDRHARGHPHPLPRPSLNGDRARGLERVLPRAVAARSRTRLDVVMLRGDTGRPCRTPSGNDRASMASAPGRQTMCGRSSVAPVSWTSSARRSPKRATATEPCFLVCGEPGIGKSRLMEVLAASARADGWSVLARSVLGRRRCARVLAVGPGRASRGRGLRRARAGERGRDDALATAFIGLVGRRSRRGALPPVRGGGGVPGRRVERAAGDDRPRRPPRRRRAVAAVAPIPRDDGRHAARDRAGLVPRERASRPRSRGPVR